MAVRTQIVKRKTNGYRVVEYLPNFGGFNVHETFFTKRSAEMFARKLKKKK